MKGELASTKVAILLCDGFEEVEMTKPRAALKQQGFITHLISPNAKKVRAWNHDHWTKKYKVDVPLDKAKPDNYGAILLPGGVMNPDHLRTNKAAVNFVKHFFQKNKPIAAICHGPWTLVETGKIKNRKLTSYHSIKTDMINAGARWQDKKVVIDGNLVTSRQPDDIPAFNKAINKIFGDYTTKLAKRKKRK